MTPTPQEERSHSTTLEKLDADIRACMRCADSLARRPVSPMSRPEGRPGID